MQNQVLTKFLHSGVEQLNLKLPAKAEATILDYVELLHKWNQVHNLTAIRDKKSILIRHIFDSLAIFPFIIGSDILDFGSGAGIPGVPLALALPEWQFVLIDSSSKKTTFLNYVVLLLKLGNVKVVNQRIEEFRFDSGFDTIVTRATDTTETVVAKTNHIPKESGQILMMKGKKTHESPPLGKTLEIHPIMVPYLNESRHLVKILNKRD